jgi:DNA-binding MarR family transcriptional regulator
MATIDPAADGGRPTGGPALLREVARLHVRAQRATLACDGASTTTCTILTELGREPSMTLAQLARRLRLDKGWTSRAVDQLVDRGLVEKVGSDSDRRTIEISLTRAGQAEHRRLERILNGQVTRVIGRIPSAQRSTVERALALLHEAYLVELAADAAAAAASTREVAS